MLAGHIISRPGDMNQYDFKRSDIRDLAPANYSSINWVAIIPNIGPLRNFTNATLHITRPENDITGRSAENLDRKFSPLK